MSAAEDTAGRRALLIELRALARAEHSDLSIGADAADELVRLEAEVERLKQVLAAERLRSESWRGEVRALLHDRPQALGRGAREVVDELVAEVAAADARAAARREVSGG